MEENKMQEETLLKEENKIQEERPVKEEKKKKRRQKLHEVSLEQDIRYRGPLSYRHLRIIGWLCIAAGHILVVTAVGAKLSPDIVPFPNWVTIILGTMRGLTIPLFLLATFSLILDVSNGYKKQLLTNGLAAAGIAGVLVLLYLRYGLGLGAIFLGDRAAAATAIDHLLAIVNQNHSRAFNFFVDFFLCTLFMFFLDYKPKKVFTEKKLVIFRLFAIFPILYEVASLLLQLFAERQIIELPAVIYPFLTTKPFLMFIVFLVLAAIIKNRERVFRKNGRTHEEYRAFLKTNRNSLHFSRFTSITFACAGLIDFILYAILMYIQQSGRGQTTEIINSFGIGTSCLGLLILAPVVLLFSYTRRYKNIWPDVVIPLGGVVLIIIVYLEGFLYGVHQLLPGLGG